MALQSKDGKTGWPDGGDPKKKINRQLAKGRLNGYPPQPGDKVAKGLTTTAIAESRKGKPARGPRVPADDRQKTNPRIAQRLDEAEQQRGTLQESILHETFCRIYKVDKLVTIGGRNFSRTCKDAGCRVTYYPDIEAYHTHVVRDHGTSEADAAWVKASADAMIADANRGAEDAEEDEDRPDLESQLPDVGMV